ncbi:cadmium-translocating P-type ATPase [Helicobacter sp. CLO-3]|uniref:heavy metal translocating P-type ATPase n=1 Tax=unclassified Helicobacter TaxID=2593540 RepID=UPI0008059FC1|nr:MULTISPECIES: heavy metal translocating P-type ATPase [unclassified Helicobacter]OBV30164.1 cadmium-translocating P-type ATPase [Helicobacter sp. CLO-3]OHU80987.1 cadmium-translocating P-type ATPase [Helicobacter sp. CLO-3]
MKRYKIENLDCANCASKLESALRKTEGVKNVAISFASGVLLIDCDDFDKAKKVIKKLEPDVVVSDEAQGFDNPDSNDLDSGNLGARGGVYAGAGAESKKLDSSVNSEKSTESSTRESSADSKKLESATQATQNASATKTQTTPAKPRRFSFLNAELMLLIALVLVFIPSVALNFFYVDPMDGTDRQSEYEFYTLCLRCVWIVIYVIAGREVFKGALKSFRKKEFFDENVLMLSASIAAFFIGAWEEAVSIMLFFSAGEYLQNLSVRRSRESIGELAHFAPPQAHKVQGEDIIAIDAQDVGVDDEVVVYAGEMVPTDALLLDDEASFDTSALSGESLPVGAKKGDEILAGSIALGKVVRLKSIRPYGKSQIAKITELIQNATTQKSQTENFITTFARYYTPVVFVIALFIALFPPFALGQDLNEWIYRALVVLMVSCPCALVISVPIGYFGGIAACSRASVLVKGSNCLEALSRLSLIGFDKTGTLTKGVFKVVSVVPQKGVSEAEVLGFASCAQDLSSHPIAQSIKNAYHALNHKHHISEFEELSGLGVRAVCDNREIIAGNDKILHKFHIPHDTCDIQGSIVHVSVDKRYLGYIIIADELKPDAKSVINELKSMRIEPVILSGDGKYPCQIVGEKLGIEYHGGLLPQDKAGVFFELKKRTPHKVGFVGDGINDAPTLALADVGVSMGSGSDLSRQNADVIVLNNSLESLLRAIKIAKKTKIIIYENIIFALGVKGLFIILGIVGVAGIWEAVFGDVGVALIALANAMRTMKQGKNKKAKNKNRKIKMS